MIFYLHHESKKLFYALPNMTGKIQYKESIKNFNTSKPVTGLTNQVIQIRQANTERN